MRKELATFVFALALLVPLVVIGNIDITDVVTTEGDVYVTGTLSKGSGTFVIDHPLDPENKLLYHSFVESPDVKNVYDGVVELNRNGEAKVELPTYFMALNKDYRYLLTAIGEPAPGLHVKKEVSRNRFTISGGEPGMKVSWQVTGIRKDPLIIENPIINEVEKGPDEVVDKGEFLFEGYKTQLDI